LGDSTNIIRIATVGDIPVGLYRVTYRDTVNKRGMSNIDIFANLRGRGLGTLVLQAGVSMAFNELGIKTLDAEILAHNIASIKAHEKVGFTRSATRREAVYLLSNYHDSHLYWLENPNEC
jgi:RimJ/RimL family protein N-acetyltransferase